MANPANSTQATQLTTYIGQDRTWKWAAKLSWGYPFNYLRNAIQHAFGYTHIGKKVSVATAGAVLASTAGGTSNQTITTGITNPDVPRVLAVTLGGSGFAADSVAITGTNVEGKTITDTIAYTSSTGQVVGKLVFKTVTSILLKSTLGASATVTVDTTNEIGLVHRLPPGHSTAIVIQDNTLDRVTSARTNMPVLQANPSSSNFDAQFVEKNWVVPATAPDGTTFLYIFYWFNAVVIAPVKDDPQWYSTTTSTSTSSTSTSTSISSTSTSISSTSTSLSTTTSISTSTSTSISSTSTSTTTLPF